MFTPRDLKAPGGAADNLGSESRGVGMLGSPGKLSVTPNFGRGMRAIIIAAAAAICATVAEAGTQVKVKAQRQPSSFPRAVRSMPPSASPRPFVNPRPSVNPRRAWQPARPGSSVMPGNNTGAQARQWNAPDSKQKRDRDGSSNNYILIGLLTLLAGSAAAVWRRRLSRRSAEQGVELDVSPKQAAPMHSAVSMIRTMTPFTSAVKGLPEKAKISEAILKEALVEPDHQAAASPQSLPTFKVPEPPVGSGPKKIRVSRDPCTLERFTQIECTINAAVEAMLQREFHLRLTEWMMISNFWNSPARFSMPPLPLEDSSSSIEPCSLDEFVELQVAVNRMTEDTLKQEFSLLDRDWLKIKHYWYARYPRSDTLLREYKQFKAKYQRSSSMTAA